MSLRQFRSKRFYNVLGSPPPTVRVIYGVSRISIITAKTETGVSRVTVSTAKTETGVARITATTTKTITGVAKVRGTKVYTYGDGGSLPATNADLATLYDDTQVTNVSTPGNTTDVTNTSTLTYRLHQFDVYLASQQDMVITWIGKAGQATSVRNAVLQVYNFNSVAWETLATDSTTATGASMTITGTITANYANYFDVANFIYFRVYQ